MEILAGFVKYRQRLFQIGLKQGFQWINGSFVQILNRDPQDIDVVTIFHSRLSRQNFESVVQYNNSLFNPSLTKKQFDTDAYFIDAAVCDYYNFSRQVIYWFGLFSHTRQGFIWKGMLEIPLPNSEYECEYEFDIIMEKKEACHV